MDKAIQDLYDLCQLNLMEEHIADSPAWDRDTTLAAIDYKRRQIVVRLENEVHKHNQEIEAEIPVPESIVIQGVVKEDEK